MTREERHANKHVNIGEKKCHENCRSRTTLVCFLSVIDMIHNASADVFHLPPLRSLHTSPDSASSSPPSHTHTHTHLVHIVLIIQLVERRKESRQQFDHAIRRRRGRIFGEPFDVRVEHGDVGELLRDRGFAAAQLQGDVLGQHVVEELVRFLLPTNTQSKSTAKTTTRQHMN
jgi:hypothetical protein